MLRAAIELIVTLLVIYFVRSLIAIIWKAIGMSAGPGTGRPPAAGNRGSSQGDRPTQAGELKKDPVCGTFVSTAVALQKSARGQTYYFCSPQCRDRFQG